MSGTCTSLRHMVCANMDIDISEEIEFRKRFISTLLTYLSHRHRSDFYFGLNLQSSHSLSGNHISGQLVAILPSLIGKLFGASSHEEIPVRNSGVMMNRLNGLILDFENRRGDCEIC